MARSNAAVAPQVAWFCVRSQPKHEHIAARHLQQIDGVEVFNPQIRFRRPSRQGTYWVTEAMFPNYLFARFDWKTVLNQVHYAPGVSGVVHFGPRWPTVPDEIIESLRATLGENEVHLVPAEFSPGDQVQVAGGMFHGLQAVITQALPGRQRVLVLMDFLGRQATVEVPVESVVKQDYRR